MNTIAQVQTADRNMNQLQENTRQALRPILANPINYGSILEKVSLVTGLNTISHGLDRALLGWSIVRKRAAADIHDSQDTNSTPQINLILNASAPVVVDLLVF